MKKLNSKQIKELYGLSYPKQCRMRASGNTFPWYFVDGRFQADEKEIDEWYETKKIGSTAELPAGFNKRDYSHLESARQKAADKRAEKTAAKQEQKKVPA